MKTTILAVCLTAVAAAADEGEPRVVQVGLHMQQQQLLGMALGTKTHEVYVTIDSDKPEVELQRIAGIATGYVGGNAATVVTSERICRAPCREVVEVNDVTDFYVAGDGVTPSSALDLSQYGNSVNMKVKAGSTGRRFGGIMSVTGGGALLLGGLLSVGLGAMMGGDTYTSSSASFFTTAGAIGAGIGGALLVLGIVLLTGSGTDVTLSPSTAVPPPESPGPGPAAAPGTPRATDV